jgi:transposase
VGHDYRGELVDLAVKGQLAPARDDHHQHGTSSLRCGSMRSPMARTSTPWSLLPAKELGCGSATTCCRRLDEWAKAGVFEQLQAVLLDELSEAGRVDVERVSVDSFSLRAVNGGDLAGEAGGLPLAVILSAANANDATMLAAVLDDIPLIRMPSGRCRRPQAHVSGLPVPTRPCWSCWAIAAAQSSIACQSR